MTKEITKADILQAIQDKFQLRELIPEKFSFSEMVLPVYDVDVHLSYPECSYAEKSVTSGPDPYTFFTVPVSERWFLSAYNIVFMAAGAYKVTGLYVSRVNKISGATVYLDMVEGQTVSYAKYLMRPLRLDPGDALKVYVDDYTSTAALRVYIDYIKETIR